MITTLYSLPDKRAFSLSSVPAMCHPACRQQLRTPKQQCSCCELGGTFGRIERTEGREGGREREGGRDEEGQGRKGEGGKKRKRELIKVHRQWQSLYSMYHFTNMYFDTPFTHVYVREYYTLAVLHAQSYNIARNNMLYMYMCLYYVCIIIIL